MVDDLSRRLSSVHIYIDDANCHDARGEFNVFAATQPVDAARFFDRVLQQFGISLTELERIVQQIIPGFELVDEKGRLLAGSFDELSAAAQDAIRDSLKLPVSFQGILDDIDRRSRLAGFEQTPEVDFQHQLEAARRAQATAIDAAFGGIDLQNAEAVRAAAQKLLDDLNAGLIDPLTLGGLDREAVLGIIDTAIEHIDALGESSRRASLEMSNIPRGFRQAALAFEAQVPQSAFRLNTTVGLNPQGLPVTTSSMDAVIEAIKTLPTGPTTVYAQIQGLNLTVEELYDKIVEIGRRRGEAGDPNSLTVGR